jgi:hypothetical protein
MTKDTWGRLETIIGSEGQTVDRFDSVGQVDVRQTLL